MKPVLGIVSVLLMPVLALAAGQLGAIRGNVVDSAGRPVAGALVTMAAGPATLDRMVFTDTRGIFVFDNLSAGEYTVQAAMTRFATSPKEKILLAPGANAAVKFNLQTIAEVLLRATSRDARQDIVWTLRSSRGTQSVLRYTDSASTSLFGRLLPDYSGYLQLYSKSDPGAQTVQKSMGSRFSVTLGLPTDARVTFTGQYNESPLEPKGASALYEFNPADDHQTKIGISARQGIILDDAFSAEELKELQVHYEDKFHLTESIVIEQGAQVGHAQGRRANNYVRPKLAVSWVPNSSTVFMAAVSTQAPGKADDPVRGREYFEQVNLPPSYEHYLHTEFAASQFLDDVTKVSLVAFEDRSNFRALFIRESDGRRGLLLFDGKESPSRGLRFTVNREFHGLEAGLGYTWARGTGIGTSALDADEIRRSMNQRSFHVVTARLKTDFELTDTELTAVYRWVSRYAAGPIDPYQQMMEYNDPSLSFSVAQNLPTFGAIPAKVQAIFDARNLLEQPIGGSSKTQLIHSPRFVKGGINIRF
jgi:hypothetical protein